MERTLSEWKSWIQTFRKTTFDVYERDWERVREDFSSESRVKDDYKGRALLELLQNADDAQIPEAEVTPKVGDPKIEFRLTRNAFYCANGGHLITGDGLDSICRMSHSAKDKTRPRIGEKGLGFKSVLSFTKTPEIHSGNLHCKFNRKEAFDWIYSSDVVRKNRPELTHDKISLLRVPIVCEPESNSHDPLIDQFLTHHATVVKMPLAESDFDAIRLKLLEVSPTILLFLNYLKTLIINIEGSEPKTYQIHRGDPQKRNCHEVVDCELTADGNLPTNWRVTRRPYDVPSEKVTGMGLGWEDVKQCAIAFALPFKDDQHTALEREFDNSIRVFFPTEEPFPLPVLFHATYYTDSSRKHINAEHTYNQFVTEKAVDFFVSELLPSVADEQLVDAGGHLDLLTTTTQREKSVGKYFADLLLKQLADAKIFPDCGRSPRLAGEVNQLPFDIAEWKEWYELLGQKGCDSLKLVHFDCSLGDRPTLMDELGIQTLDFATVVNVLEALTDHNADWFSRVYKAVNRFTQGKPESEINVLNSVCEASTLLHTSDDKVVSCATAKVFMPPDGEGLRAIPDWLRIKFVDPTTIQLLGENKEQVLNTFLARFGVKRYQTREIVREVLSSNMRDYWDGKKTRVEFDPMQLLHFLFELVGPDLTGGHIRPEGQTYEALLQVPVPATNPSGALVWSKAGETYFSKGWLGSDLLERLYGFDQGSRYLCPERYFVEENNFSSERLSNFFYYLGVEDRPRVITLRSRKVAKATETAGYYSEYLREYHLDSRQTGYWMDEIEYECTLDRITDIMARPFEAKVLLNYISANPGLCPDKSAIYRYSYHGEKSQYISTNFFKWLLSNSLWLYDDQDNPRRPFEIYMPNRDLRRRFSDYLPYVKYQTEPIMASWQDVQAFLLRIGVKQNIDDFDAAHWYKILGDLASTWEDKAVDDGSAERIRAIYRDMLRSDLKIDEVGAKVRDDFITNGKLLAVHGSQSKFYPVNEMFYVDRLDLLYEMRQYVPCFQVETNREERILDLFGVPSLSSSRKVSPDLGSKDPTLIDPLNAFLMEAKPFLLARLRGRRTDKADISRIRNLTIEPVTKIVITTSVTHPSTSKQITIPPTEVESLLDTGGDSHGFSKIYLDARIIKPAWKRYSDFRHDDGLVLALSTRLAELFKLDLSEAFQLLLSKDNLSRQRILRDAHIDEELMRECRSLLAQQDDVVNEGPTSTTEEPTEETTETPTEKEAPQEPPGGDGDHDDSAKRRIWGEDGRDLEFGTPNQVESSVTGAEKGTSTAHGHYGSGYQPDVALRNRTDAAGMKVAMEFERKSTRIPDDTPSKKRGSGRRAGPGCDIHSKDDNGRLLRRIEVKSSLSDNVESVELTHSEVGTARNELSGNDFYIYRVIKLDADKYPQGPELLIFHDPYPEAIGKATAVSVRFQLTDLSHEIVRIGPEKSVKKAEDG